MVDPRTFECQPDNSLRLQAMTAQLGLGGGNSLYPLTGNSSYPLTSWQQQQQQVQWPQAYYSLGVSTVQKFRFFRINTEVEEGAEKEPLDELRIKVAKWLRRI